jgi:hypothetical protein
MSEVKNEVGIVFNDRFKKRMSLFKDEYRHLINCLDTENVRALEEIQNELRDKLVQIDLNDFDWINAKKIGKPEFYALFLCLITPLDNLTCWENFVINSELLHLKTVDATDNYEFNPDENATCACGKQGCMVDYMGLVRCDKLRLLVGSVCVEKEELTACDVLVKRQRQKTKERAVLRNIFDAFKGNEIKQKKIKLYTKFKKFIKFVEKNRKNLDRIRDVLKMDGLPPYVIKKLQGIVDNFYEEFTLSKEDKLYIDAWVKIKFDR